MDTNSSFVWAAGLAILFFLVWAFMKWQSLALIHDPLDVVQKAALGTLTTNHASEQMTDLPFGWFGAFVDTDSQFEIECRDGQRLIGGYMTVYSGMTKRIGETCAFRNQR